MPAGRCEERTCRDTGAWHGANEPAIRCMSGEHESRQQACCRQYKRRHCLLHWPVSVVVRSGITMEGVHVPAGRCEERTCRDTGAWHGANEPAIPCMSGEHESRQQACCTQLQTKPLLVALACVGSGHLGHHHGRRACRLAGASSARVATQVHGTAPMSQLHKVARAYSTGRPWAAREAARRGRVTPSGLECIRERHMMSPSHAAGHVGTTGELPEP
jgi:hypothetical protein